jgi:hypothetical protein
MDPVLLERDPVGDLDRHRPQVRLQVERAQPAHEISVKIGDRTGDEGNAVAPAVARLDAELMVDEIEIDLEIPRAMRHRRGRQPPRGHIERHLPPMVDQRRVRQTDLADDLGQEVQRGATVLPLGVIELRPRGFVRSHGTLPCGTGCNASFETAASRLPQDEGGL